ncbi:hypothetical protein [Brevibacillus laterosporus]|uniref:hypothetical protein n=1 Tax=Brevibacillus laterosporus TaxID=1465 RepID=UPI000839B9DB|nr:hypothetical protein [Brevibacillus laterosporus]
MQYHKKPLERVLFPGCGETFSTASYLTEATTVVKGKGLFKEELMQHISPLGWDISILLENTLSI